MEVLYRLQEMYDFKIKNVELKDSSVFTSFITILCNEEDKDEIFKKFIQMLSSGICNIRF